jgi:predicted nucleic acid-binding protein
LVRLLTIAEVLAYYNIPPLTNREAWAVVESFMADERITFASVPAGVEDAWKTMAIRDTNSPKLWMNAWLAAFALRAGLQMITTDKEFSQFKHLELLMVKAR